MGQSVNGFPKAALAQHIAVLGKTGSGKSYAVRGIVEGLLDDNARVCIVDPTSAWHGLRSSVSGKSGGYPVVIFGGDHADLPLSGTHGEAIAETIGTSSTPAIIDTRLMRTRERVQFFTDFAEGILRKNKGPLHLVIDEAHIFAPQGKVSDPKSGEMLHAANNLVSLGRSRGLRIILITQRPAKLHKDSLTQVETLVAMRLIAPQDRKAVEEWIKDNADDAKGREILSSLATLKTGTGWVWSPELNVLEKVSFPRIKTFDTGRAPDGSEQKGAVLAPIDVDAIAAKLRTVAADALANDPAALKKRIAELERFQIVATKSIPADAEALNRARFEAFHACADIVLPLLTEIRQTANTMVDRCNVLFDAIEFAPKSFASQSPRIEAKPTAAVKRTAQISDEPRVDAGLSRPQQLILDRLHVLYHRGIYPASRATLAAFCKVSPSSSGYEKNLGTLKTLGLVEYPRQGEVGFTAHGLTAAAHPDDDGTPAADFWISIVNEPKAKILRALVDEHPNAMSRGAIAQAVDASASSSGFEKNLAQLKTLGAIDYPMPGVVALTPYVMP